MDQNSEETIRYGNVVFIQGNKNGKYPFCNTLLIDDKVCALVDAGAGRAKMMSVRERKDVKVLINSHFHEDHTCYNYLFPDAEVWGHPADAPPMGDVDSYMNFAWPMSMELWSQWKAIIVDRFHYVERPPTRLIVDGELLDFGDTYARVVHTPGHTPGHISLHFPDEGVLFLADIDLTRFGPFYGDRYGDIDALIASVKKLMAIDAKVYICGHEAGPFDDIQEPGQAYIDVIEKRESRIYDALRKPMTLEEIVSLYIIYRKSREPKDLLDSVESAMIVKHLERMERNGLLVRDGLTYQSK